MVLHANSYGFDQLRYDIWGVDSMVANSMESDGIPGGIVISEQTKWFDSQQ